MNNRVIFGIASIVLAAVIAFVAIPAVSSRTNGVVEVVRVVQAVEKGRQVTAGDLELVEVGAFNLPSVARSLEDVVGRYASSDLIPGDYIQPMKVSESPISSDFLLSSLPSGKVAISFTIKSMAAGLSDKLQSGDIVRIYHFQDFSTMVPELQFIQVLAVTDSTGLDVDASRTPTEDEEKQQAATVTVLATPDQARLITEYENAGTLHVALISRGDSELAATLLEQQDALLGGAAGDGVNREAPVVDAAQPVPAA